MNVRGQTYQEIAELLGELMANGSARNCPSHGRGTPLERSADGDTVNEIVKAVANKNSKDNTPVNLFFSWCSLVL